MTQIMVHFGKKINKKIIIGKKYEDKDSFTNWN